MYCVFDKATDRVTKNEMGLKAGKEHGTFYNPQQEWLTPDITWINQKALLRKKKNE